MKPRDPRVVAAARKVAQQFADKGIVIQGGFIAYCLANQITNEAARLRAKDAYYAGAENLFMTIMGTLDPGTEATPLDLMRMDGICQELTTWQKEQELKFTSPEGNA